jgi:hypothetical protein
MYRISLFSPILLFNSAYAKHQGGEMDFIYFIVIYLGK